MKRRNFIRNSTLAGSLAALPLGASGAAAGTGFAGMANGSQARNVKYDFKRYCETSTMVPVQKVTPDDGYYLHTFYDICPWSPSQRDQTGY